MPPPMLLRVTHRTAYHYPTSVTHNRNELRLAPRDFRDQQTRWAFLSVRPASRLAEYADFHGNRVHTFEVSEPHDTLTVESRFLAEKQPFHLRPESQYLTFDQLATHTQPEQIFEFLGASHYVSLGSDVWKQAIDLRDGSSCVYEVILRIMQTIHNEFTYDKGATTVHTHMADVLRLRKGVCQDFAHVMLALCRSLRIPTRYASGYLFNGGRQRLRGDQASHAWVEVYFPHSGWIGFDPTNNQLADERYVKVAVGRDYEEVAPVRGSYRGHRAREMVVSVTVEQAGT